MSGPKGRPRIRALPPPRGKQSGARVIICIPHLKMGGAERQALELAKDLSIQNWDVVLLVLRPLAGKKFLTSSFHEEYPFVKVWDWLTRHVSGETESFAANNAAAVQNSSNHQDSVEILAPSENKASFGLGAFGATRSTTPEDVNHGSRNTFLAHVKNQVCVVGTFLKKPQILSYAVSLKIACAKWKPELVIAFTPNANLTASLAAKRAPFSAVVSERNDFTKMAFNRMERCAQLFLYKNADLITANTQIAVSDLRGLFPSKHVSWLPNSSKYRATNNAAALSGGNACVIARLEPQKRVAEIIAGFAQDGLHHRFGISLHIFGSGSEERPIRSLITNLGLDGFVTLHGSKRFAEIPLQALDIGFLISNSRFEGSSNSIHEAVAAGLLPLVSHDVRELRSILRPSLHPRVIFDSSSADMAKKLDYLLRNQRQRATLQSMVRRDFKSYWSACDKQRNELTGELADLAHVLQRCEPSF